jgi:hypothetical protein
MRPLIKQIPKRPRLCPVCEFTTANHRDSAVAAIGTKLFLAKIIIAYAVTYSVTYIATGSGKAAQGAGLSAALFMGIGENLPPPITEIVPPTTASLAVLPIISNIFFECPDDPR